MQLKKAHFLYFFLSGLFLFVDQLTKYFFVHHPKFSWYIFKPWLGLEYFENPGIAFSLQVPSAVIIVLTPFVLLGILLFFFKNSPSPKKSLALALLLSGAVSNFIDRIFFEFTVDYIRVFTSILNIADILIVVGVCLLAFDEIRKK